MRIGRYAPAKKSIRPSYKIKADLCHVLGNQTVIFNFQTSKENVETHLTISGFSQDSTCYNEDLRAVSIGKVLKYF